MNYRLFVITFIIGCLVSCSANIKVPNITERVPDTLNKDTLVNVPKDTPALAPKAIEVKTIAEEKTEATLAEDVHLEGIPEVILPKNTPIELPPNTKLVTEPNQLFVLPQQSEVILPRGTEVTTTKMNWYAILFYALLIGCAAWHYFQVRKEVKKS